MGYIRTSPLLAGASSGQPRPGLGLSDLAQEAQADRWERLPSATMGVSALPWAAVLSGRQDGEICWGGNIGLRAQLQALSVSEAAAMPTSCSARDVGWRLSCQAGHNGGVQYVDVLCNLSAS